MASGEEATVPGGEMNIAQGDRACVGGGASNEASGEESTIPGGFNNTASGLRSFAAGRRAMALHNGSFVWADNLNQGIKSSSANNQFNVYANGGTRIFSSSTLGAETGVMLAPGGRSWTSVSDRDAKENVEMVNGRRVLEQLASVPVSTWSYKAQDDSIRHMGPMAQDFYAAFGLGVDERGIDTIDADGVALAAIKGLSELFAEKDAEVEALRARVYELEKLQGEISSLRAAVSALAGTE